MNMQAQQPTDDARRAALTLHALGRADRDWLLAQLSMAEQNAMTALLDELTELGIPKDKALVREALGFTSPESDAAARLSADPSALWAVLAKEPRGVQLACMGLLSDFHRAALLAAIPDRSKAQALARAFQPLPDAAGELRAALLSACLARLASPPSGSERSAS